jgi:hypothetical protein
VQKKNGGVWRDFKGLAFVDVGSKPFWEYIVEIGKESYAIGFDELNFDYVRYPSDGNLQDADFSQSAHKEKAAALEEFFAYLHDNLEGTGAVLSADLFGLTTYAESDLNIGQVLERALPYFDYVYPMVYPSHYAQNFNGWGDPNERPYDIIKYSMDEAQKRMRATSTTIAADTHERVGTSTPPTYRKPSYESEKLRPWLQSFDYPVNYTPGSS